MTYIQYLQSLSRPNKILIQVASDCMLLILAFLGAILFRTESLTFQESIKIWIIIVASILFAILSFHFLGLYRAVVRFLSIQISIIVSKGIFLAIGIIYLSSYIFQLSVSNSDPIVFGLLGFMGVVGVRLIAQSVFRSYTNGYGQPVIVYGAGGAGRQLVNALNNSREYMPIAFVDDDPHLQQLSVEGLLVKSPREIEKIAQKGQTNVVLLAMPTVDLARRREIIEILNMKQLEVRTIPPISDIVSGRSRLSNVKNVRVEDLLGRDPISPHPELLTKNIGGHVVMVTGAGGSIGSELCRQIFKQKPTTLILFELSEVALYTIDIELSEIAARLHSSVNVVPILGSVNDSQLLEHTLKKFGVQTIFHAAAYKHVPLLEENVVSGIRNNVFGTLAITTAAKKLGVKNFVLISSDKAVRPTNLMGATKRIAEQICQVSATEASQTIFSIVRFGNVLGSSGSVIPRFQKQIEEGGPVTVTHRDVVRYFMTVSEAAQLVIQAAAMSKGGDVFVLDMGDPIKIVDVAKAMIQLNGMTPHLADEKSLNDLGSGGIAICFTGLRKGEKLYEELLIGDNSSPTQHTRIITASESHLPMDELNLQLGRLSLACDEMSVPVVFEIISAMQLGFDRSHNLPYVKTFRP